MPLVSIGVIGLGFGSHVHVPAFLRDERCQVAALSGRTEGKAAEVAAKLGIAAAYDDWRHIVDDPAVSAVSIAVPPAAQPAIAEAALNAGKHVFCEKPLAAHADDANRLAALAAQRGVVHAVDFIFPEVERWREARHLISDGRLGVIRHAVVDWRVETYAARMNTQSWKNNPSSGGGVLNNFVSHVVHNVETLFGAIDSVSADLRGPRGRSETCVHATLDMAGGFPVFLSIGSDAFLGHGHRVAAYGEDGTMLLENRTADYAAGFELRFGERGQKDLRLLAKDEAQPGVDGRIAPVARIARRFVDSIISGSEMRPNFQDGARAQLILEQMLATSGKAERSLRVPQHGR